VIGDRHSTFGGPVRSRFDSTRDRWMLGERLTTATGGLRLTVDGLWKDPRALTADYP
jgi:hypothetical protein